SAIIRPPPRPACAPGRTVPRCGRPTVKRRTTMRTNANAFRPRVGALEDRLPPTAVSPALTQDPAVVVGRTEQAGADNRDAGTASETGGGAVVQIVRRAGLD